jgi:hypothetical protein
MTTIKPQTTITARSICDHNCIFSAYVVSRKGDWIILSMDGKTFRKKIQKTSDGSEYVYALGKYSMSPVFQ